MNAIQELANLTKRLNDLVDSMPARAKLEALSHADDINRLDISPNRNHYGSAPPATERALKIANMVREQTKDRVAEMAIAGYQQSMTRIALEIEQIRAVLPSLAARAAIEAGVKAREIAATAGKPPV